jgi:hypothetical protein
MVRQRSSSKTNGLEKEKITISLWTISKRKITSLKGYAKFNLKLEKMALRKRSKEKESLSRYAFSSLIKVKEKALVNINFSKIRIKIHDLS